MAGFVDFSYDDLAARATRIENFFSDLENKLSTISAPTIYHLHHLS